MKPILTFATESRTPLLTTQEVAMWLGMREGTLRYWRHTKRGPRSIAVGGAVRYRREDVEAWLDARTREPRSVIAR
jgi:excisionase family DNA binding protein